MRKAFAAIDLGGESGRVVVGTLDGSGVSLDVAHRFPNRPVQLPDGLHWNLLALYSSALDGLVAAGAVDGIGVDAWGCDYALLDAADRVLGLPFHYRDARTRGMTERVDRDELYSVTGIQTLPINTVFQLLAESDSAALREAHGIAFVPDLFGLWLTGTLANERTIASTSGLLDARTGEWATGLIERLGLPTRPFGALVDPGTRIGDRDGVPVYAVASHDTASAFAAAPVEDVTRAAILSSGTWSLLGLELDAPVTTELASAYDLTNERGIDGTIRLLKNVMGLWLLQECHRAWDLDYDELQRLAAGVIEDVPLFDPDLEQFLAPGTDMPERIVGASGGTLEPALVTRSILTSLACKYRLVVERLEQTTGRSIDCVNVIGGGARNELLCRLTADVLGRRVVAGPVEVTALGNVLVQARAAGVVDDIRAVARASASPAVYEPAARDDATYQRFLAATGLTARAAAHA